MINMNPNGPVTRVEFEDLSATLERLDRKFSSRMDEMESHLCTLEKSMHKLYSIKHYVDMALSAVLGGGSVYVFLQLLHLLK